MFEYHGWVTVQLAAGDEESDDIQVVNDRVAELLKPLESAPGLASLQWVNGMAQVQLTGFLNHCGEQGREVVEIFHAISKVAPGSYGLLDVHDDEDTTGASNEFVVHVMRRGEVAEEHDRFLSPVALTIEDA